ncbi:hypothetical protein KY285_023281 [Solanum tuberosum]|nr:hypothetical protein KY289_023618 [Solanum tuberosum]KAH0675480.1 hypothetical protein KY285_023281 [Solanum tuberosum]
MQYANIYMNELGLLAKHLGGISRIKESFEFKNLSLSFHQKSQKVLWPLMLTKFANGERKVRKVVGYSRFARKWRDELLLIAKDGWSFSQKWRRGTRH